MFSADIGVFSLPVVPLGRTGPSPLVRTQMVEVSRVPCQGSSPVSHCPDLPWLSMSVCCRGDINLQGFGQLSTVPVLVCLPARVSLCVCLFVWMMSVSLAVSP